MVDRIKAQNYYDAANELFAVASGLAKAQTTLAADLAGTDGMNLVFLRFCLLAICYGQVPMLTLKDMLVNET